MGWDGVAFRVDRPMLLFDIYLFLLASSTKV